MARSDEATAFFYAVYRAVQEIPPGRVTSYGHIARLVGTRMISPPLTSLSDASVVLNYPIRRPLIRCHVQLNVRAKSASA